jgi:hypothetical protein
METQRCADFRNMALRFTCCVTPRNQEGKRVHTNERRIVTSFLWNEFFLFFVCKAKCHCLFHLSLNESELDSRAEPTGKERHVSKRPTFCGRVKVSTCCLLEIFSIITSCTEICFFTDSTELIQGIPYQGSSWRFWRLQNSRTSNSHCEIYTWHCAAG